VRDEQKEIGKALHVWAVIAGAILAGAIAALFAAVPVWGWIALVAFILLTGVALLSFSDLASRNFLAGTLRHRTYTQIYTTLTRRMVQRLWAALCDEPGNPKQMEREPVPTPTLFRHALTWRLYDKALLIAVAYPILLPVLQWLLTGEAAMVGSFEFLATTPFLWERAAILTALAILLVGMIAPLLAGNGPKHGWHRLGHWGTTTAGLGAMALAATFSNFATALAVVGAVSLASASSGTGALAMTAAIAAAFIYLFALSSLFSWVAMTVGIATAASAVTVIWMTHNKSPQACRWLVTITAPVTVLSGIALIDFGSIPEDLRALFLFLAVLPLLNALFDTLSYATTLTLMRRGLRSRLPLLWGLLDLAIACLLFLALGATLIVVIHGLNTLAGVPLVDLSALLAAIHETPADYLWLYAMLFSTILPTAAHGCLSLLGVQGLWPRAWRRPVAAWVEGATASALAYLRAGLALGAIWTLPLLALGGIVWLLWALAGTAMIWMLGRYFDLLLWLAAVPVGLL
jgi:hypothetical protein